jgi:hypothetical protein
MKINWYLVKLILASYIVEPLDRKKFILNTNNKLKYLCVFFNSVRMLILFTYFLVVNTLTLVLLLFISIINFDFAFFKVYHHLTYYDDFLDRYNFN